MPNFVLKTQVNDNPPQLWTLGPFGSGSDAVVEQRLNYLMGCHFSERLDSFDAQPIESTKFFYFVGGLVILDGGFVYKGFTRESAKACIANSWPLPSKWRGTPEEFNNYVLTRPDDQFNDCLALYGRTIPALDEPSSYRDTLKILRTTAEDAPWYGHPEYWDAFNFLKEQVVNHVTELDNSGFSVATLEGDVIVFTAEAMVLKQYGT